MGPNRLLERGPFVKQWVPSGWGPYDREPAPWEEKKARIAGFDTPVFSDPESETED